MDNLPTVISGERPFSRPSHIQRIRCQPGDLYKVIFLDHQDRIVVPLTEWYHQRQTYGSRGTRETYLTCLLPYLSFLIEQECPWNAPPERLRPALIAFTEIVLAVSSIPEKIRSVWMLH